MSVTINQQIPNISFEVYHDKKIVSCDLDDFIGKWVVIYFYPADFTYVCPTELKEAASKYPDLKAMNTEIISFSTDSVHVHKAWHDSSPALQAIEFPMAADPTGKIAQLFGVYMDVEGTAQRSTFIINPQGILKAYEVHDNDIGRSISEIMRKLKALQYVARHTGEMCPASWDVGKKTVKPD